jgi:glycerol-1-phosphate dehydrogenase [NAD(P)+]
MTGSIAVSIPDGSARCSCGVTHRVAIEQIVVGSDAFERLADFAQSRRWRRALLVMDANTEQAAGHRVADALRSAGVAIGSLRFPNAGLAADQQAVSAARARLRDAEPEGVVAVGSGVLTDITRYAAHREGRGFVSVPTAASMDGYASGVAAMEFGGLKVTYPAGAPLAIFAEPAVLAAAPHELTRAGLGDLLGKASARVDWLASHLLYGEPFCAAVDERILGPLGYAANHHWAVLRGEQEAIERLLAGLLESGLAMAMMGSSRPASGCEHHASHFWDLLAARGAREHELHGLQVGYAAQFAIRLQRFAFAGGVPELKPPSSQADEEDARAWLGEPSPAIREAMLSKQRFIAERAGSWPGADRWPALRRRISAAMGGTGAVEQALEAAGLPPLPGILGIGAGTLRATFRFANRLRARYTVLDFLQGQGGLGEALDAVLPEGQGAHAAGSGVAP